jgi:hypothetical protein
MSTAIPSIPLIATAVIGLASLASAADKTPSERHRYSGRNDRVTDDHGGVAEELRA